MSTTGRGDAPRRVRVTSPRRTARRRAPERTRAAEVEEQTGLGELYITSLIKAQLRLALVVLIGVTAVIGSLPLILLMFPQVGAIRVGVIPNPWLVLGALVYPFAVAVSRAYVRASERVERDFSDLMGRP